MRVVPTSSSSRLLFAAALLVLGLILREWWLVGSGGLLMAVVTLNRYWARHWAGGLWGSALVLFAVGAGLAALLLWSVFGSSAPRATTITIALIGLLPVSIFTYLGVVIAYFGFTGRRAPGAAALGRVLQRLNRPM